MSGTIATGSAPGGASAGTIASVSSCAFAPYASHHARWNAQPEKGVAQGFSAASESQVVRGMSAIVRRSTRSGEAGAAPASERSGAGQAGSASRVREVTPRLYIQTHSVAQATSHAQKRSRGPSERVDVRGWPDRLPDDEISAVGARPAYGCRRGPFRERPPALPDERDAAVRGAPAHPLDPGERQVRRVLQQLPADGELP